MDLNFKDVNEGTCIIADDVLIVGNDSNTTGSHDHHLIQVLNNCHEIGLKINVFSSQHKYCSLDI